MKMVNFLLVFICIGSMMNNCFAGKNPEADGQLLEAAGSGNRANIAQVKTALDNGADVNAKPHDLFFNEEGNTALIVAAGGTNSLSREESKDIVELLINKGADVNAKNKDGTTALMEANFQQKKDIVNLLLAAGADVNAKDKDDNTTLMYAWWDKDIVKRLLEAGADVNVKNKYGKTALMFTVARGNIDVVKLLLAAGADANAQDWKGGTAITFLNKVVPEEYPEVVKLPMLKLLQEASEQTAKKQKILAHSKLQGKGIITQAELSERIRGHLGSCDELKSKMAERKELLTLGDLAQRRELLRQRVLAARQQANA